jgi:hypothetical protein
MEPALLASSAMPALPVPPTSVGAAGRAPRARRSDRGPDRTARGPGRSSQGRQRARTRRAVTAFRPWSHHFPPLRPWSHRTRLRSSPQADGGASRAPPGVAPHRVAYAHNELGRPRSPSALGAIIAAPAPSEPSLEPFSHAAAAAAGNMFSRDLLRPADAARHWRAAVAVDPTFAQGPAPRLLPPQTRRVRACSSRCE